MNIGVRLEGGVGDCILGCRFIPAIRNKYYAPPYFTAYIDSEDNPIQERVIRYIYPNLFNDIFTIPRKKYSKMIIESQFGKEEMKGFIENVPDEYRKMMDLHDKFYDLHIDSLKFLNYNINWQDYFYKLIPPNTHKSIWPKRFICSHLVSSSSPVHRMESWYVEQLIEKIDKLALDLEWDHIIISTPEINIFYDNIIKKCKNSYIINGTVEEVCDFASQASAFIGVDSAWRLLSYANKVPTITLSKDCSGWGGVSYAHQLRWLCWPQTTFGLHHDSSEVIGLLKNMIQSQVFRVIPKLSLYGENANNMVIKRDYKICEQESILNV